MKKTILLFLSVLLTACANSRCNPRLDTDPFSTIGCSMNGGYNRAVSSAQNNVNISRGALSEQQRQLDLLRGQQAQLEHDLQTSQTALADMEAQLDAFNRKLQQDRNQTKKILKEQARLKQEINSQKNRNASLERALADKKKQVEDLNNFINK